jgi:uncharacterized membrane protein
MKPKNWTVTKALPFILIVCGLVGLFCAFVLTQDKIKLLENPNTHLGCSLDPIISCGSVIQSAQGHAFGFPNPYLGLSGFAAMVTIGVVLLAGARLKRWFWLSLEAGVLFAVGFIHWLFYQTVYSIHALCLYCIAVWIITITSFWYATLYNFDQKHIRLPKGRPQAVYTWVRKHHLDILLLWFLVIAALTLKHFWYYYGPKLT